MATNFPDLFNALAAPFHASDVKTRTQGGRSLSYITARTVMNRLDDVLGPENWWDEYVPGENSVLCKVTIRLPDGQLLTKADAGGFAEMKDAGDADKSGYSDAFKRAAVKFGIGRYLYGDGVPIHEEPIKATARVKEPARELATVGVNGHGHANGNGVATEDFILPAEWGATGEYGRDFFKWLKSADKTVPGLLKAVNDKAAEEGFSVRMLGWSQEEVERAYKFARACIRKRGGK